MKKYISVFLMFSIILTGCSSKKNESITIVENNDLETALRVSGDYLSYLKDKNFSGIRRISSDDLNSSTDYGFKGDMEISSFNKSDFGDIGSRAFVKYDVNSIRYNEPTCSLEEYVLYVKQKGEKGIVEEVKSKEKSRVFVKNKNLRIVSENNGFSKLLFRWSDLPREVYPKSNKADIAKKQIIFNRFGIIGFNYSGTNLGISAQCDGGEYIGVLNIDETIATVEEVGVDENLDGLEEMVGEKPMARKIITLDFLENAKVERIVFSRDETNVIVQYNVNGVNRINIYNSESGKIMDCKTDDLFPKDKYNVELYNTAEYGLLVDVNPLEGKDANQSVLGRYFLNLKDLKFYKI